MRYVLPLLLFVALAMLLFAGLGKDTRYVPSPLIDKPAAAFTLPELRDGTRVIDSKQFAGQPYLLNVWGSWCVACQEEHPVLLDYAKSKKIPLVDLLAELLRLPAQRLGALLVGGRGLLVAARLRAPAAV